MRPSAALKAKANSTRTVCMKCFSDSSNNTHSIHTFIQHTAKYGDLHVTQKAFSRIIYILSHAVLECSIELLAFTYDLEL